jgi:hypothetical protein
MRKSPTQTTMDTPKPLSRVLLALGLGLAAAAGLQTMAKASGTEAAPGTSSPAARSLATLDARVQTADRQVRSLIGEAPCQADSECRSAAYGARACGGPQAYLAWSTRTTDPQALDQALERHAALRRDQLAARGESSICAFLTDPGARCKPAATTAGPQPPTAAAAGRCVINERGREDTRR